MVKDSAYYDGYWDNVGKYEWREEQHQQLKEKEHGDTQRHHRGLDTEPSEQPKI
jgi:hypothetical protein